MLSRLLAVAICCALFVPTPSEAIEFKTSTASDAVDALIAAENQRMSSLRASYIPMFEQAYARYPQIPRGVLEALAYTKTRWNPVASEANDSDRESAHMAPAYGVMALFEGDAPFVNQLEQASALTGLSVEQLKSDTQANILGAAALLARDITRSHGTLKAAPPVEQIGAALRGSLGLAGLSKSVIGAHLQDSLTYSVLQTLSQGVDDHGVQVKARPVALEKVLSIEALAMQKARFVSLDVSKGRVETSDYVIDPRSETLSQKNTSVAKSTDYGPALYRQSPNEEARAANPTHITIHQMEGFYAGSIATFLESGGVSAHYLIRDSDGQVTQMVREARTGYHVKGNNAYTLGIEQEGFRGQSGWYNAPTYREVIAITKNMCARWSIPCTSVYRGAASDSENVQASSLRIKGHQHYAGQAGTRTDPGRFFNWTRFADGIGGSAPPAGVLDSFESGEGRFTDTPSASGSTVGISANSSAERNNTRVRTGGGSWSEQIGLVDNTSTNANWEVRFLSGGGNPAENAKLQKAGGRLGFWAYTAAPGVTLAVSVDDSDGTERSISRTLPVNTWTFFEWKLDDGAQWDPWASGNGLITASQVSLDAIWFFRAQNANPVYIYLDDVQFKVQ